MEKKTRKKCKHGRSLRHEARLVHAPRHESVKKVKVESVSHPWLRMASGGIEDNPKR